MIASQFLAVPEFTQVGGRKRVSKTAKGGKAKGKGKGKKGTKRKGTRRRSRKH